MNRWGRVSAALLLAFVLLALGSASLALADYGGKDTFSYDPKKLGVSAIAGIPAPVAGVLGTDDKLWSISQNGRDLYRVSTTSKKGRAVKLPKRLRSLPGGAQIAVDGLGRAVIPVITSKGWGLLRKPVSGKASVIRLPKSKVRIAPSGISDLEAGPNGNLWFATSGAIGYVTTGGKLRAWKGLPRVWLTPDL